jgi:hypothetical protein
MTPNGHHERNDDLERLSRRRYKKSHDRRCPLLRQSRQRPRHGAAKPRGESRRHSITSSAMASNIGGISSSSDLAAYISGVIGPLWPKVRIVLTTSSFSRLGR